MSPPLLLIERLIDERSANNMGTRAGMSRIQTRFRNQRKGRHPMKSQ
jgi:hypothetical protein